LLAWQSKFAVCYAFNSGAKPDIVGGQRWAKLPPPAPQREIEAPSDAAVSEGASVASSKISPGAIWPAHSQSGRRRVGRTSSFDNLVQLHQDRPRTVRPGARRFKIDYQVEDRRLLDRQLPDISSSVIAAWWTTSSVMAESEIRPLADSLPQDPCMGIDIRHATTFNIVHSQFVTRLLDQMLSAATWTA